MQGVGFDVALQRAGDLVRSARAKLAQLPPNAPEAERQKAQGEVQRLEAMFFGQDSPVLEMLRVGASRAGDSDSGAAVLESQLRALGADGVTIATEQLRAVPSSDATAVIAALRKVATENRLTAMQRSGLLDALSAGSMRLTPDEFGLSACQFIFLIGRPNPRVHCNQPPGIQNIQECQSSS